MITDDPLAGSLQCEDSLLDPVSSLECDSVLL